METCYIYALVDPQTNEEFYVGSSIWLNQRFNSHIYGYTNEANQERIERITTNGFELKIRTLDEVPEELRLEREKEWINRLRDEGATLTNIRLIDRIETKQARITAIISDELHCAVKVAAAQEGKTITEVVVSLLKQWVETDKERKVEED